MTAPETLLLCPFCGKTPRIVTRDVEPQGDSWYGRKDETFVLCECGACLFDGAFHEGFWDADTRAPEAWNRRIERLGAGVEPVLWMIVGKDGARQAECTYEESADFVRCWDHNHPNNAPHRSVPLYATPPPSGDAREFCPCGRFVQCLKNAGGKCDHPDGGP